MDRFRKLGFDALESMMLYDAMQAITVANKWEWLRGQPQVGDFIHSKDMIDIEKHMNYHDHSGGSFAWTMRQMHFIARNGFAAFARLREPMEWLDLKDVLASNPDLRPQAEACAKYERGEITFEEFKQLCG